jgi:FAD/FMN-containing dehydrogenase
LNDILEQLQNLFGPNGLLLRERVAERSANFFDSDQPCIALAIVRPDSTEQTAEVLRLCHAAGQAVVPIGGGTGLVEGCLAGRDEIQLSLERMARIENIDSANRTVTVQAGVPLQAVQQAVAEQGLFLPLDLGARGSCTIGGNVSTNAGGNRVFRYGMARDMVLGLEAVLADGTIISSLNQMIKNNAGYDIKQLFIGTEGTLGIVTRVVLRLREQPGSQETAFVAVQSFDKLQLFLKQIDRALGGTLSAFEVMWNNFYRLVTEPPAVNRAPFAADYPYYVLVEAMGGDVDADRERFLTVLMQAMDDGLLADAVVAKSQAECAAMWAMRDDVEQFFHFDPWYGFDVSLPIGEMEHYVEQVRTSLASRWPDYRHVVFGHVADGNIHILVSAGEGSAAERTAVEKCVYNPLRTIGGSISAEHGIGLEKRHFLGFSRSDNEIALMKTLKNALDPRGILNPGKVLHDG